MEIYVTIRAGEGVVNILCQGIQKDELVEGNVVLVGCKSFSLNVDETSRFAADHVSLRSSDIVSYVTGTLESTDQAQHQDMAQEEPDSE